MMVQTLAAASRPGLRRRVGATRGSGTTQPEKRPGGDAPGPGDGQTWPSRHGRPHYSLPSGLPSVTLSSSKNAFVSG